jgi:hypothetical protein
MENAFPLWLSGASCFGGWGGALLASVPPIDVASDEQRDAIQAAVLELSLGLFAQRVLHLRRQRHHRDVSTGRTESCQSGTPFSMLHCVLLHCTKIVILPTITERSYL